MEIINLETKDFNYGLILNQTCKRLKDNVSVKLWFSRETFKTTEIKEIRDVFEEIREWKR